jgi:16S rRNA (cytosine967-C5)-methyltransferase
MSEYFHAYLRNASLVLESFEFKEPFALFLKSYFKKNKKFGSRDRKVVSDLCYGYLRLGNAADDLPTSSAIIAGYYLTHQSDNGFLQAVFPEFYPTITDDLTKKLKEVGVYFPSFDPADIFSFTDELSDDLESLEWGLKHLEKPEVFLRIRPGKAAHVISKLQASGIEFDQVGVTSLRLHKNIELEGVLELDKETVVQDIASQQTASLLENLPTKINSFWDACAGSGGKSIMVHDLFPKAKVFASDVREEILLELRRRFDNAGINAEKIFCNDLSHDMAGQVLRSNLPQSGVDLIVADVPCTGSGTWRRSPEWLSSFEISSIDQYVRLQQKIVDLICQHVGTNKFLLYITCSVFRKENEEMVSYILGKGRLKLLSQQHCFGENAGGDHLFAALFISEV